MVNYGSLTRREQLDPSTITEQEGLPLEDVVLVFVDKLLLVAVAALPAVHSRYATWHTTACMQLAVVVWGHEEESTHFMKGQDDKTIHSLVTDQDWGSTDFPTRKLLSLTTQQPVPDEANVTAVRTALWAGVAIIVALLVLCYRFEIWRTFLEGKHWYSLLFNKSDVPVDEHAELQHTGQLQHLTGLQHTGQLQHLAELQYPAERQHQAELQHPTELYHQAELQHPTDLYHQAELQHPTELYHQAELQHPTELYHQAELQHPTELYHQAELQHPTDLECATKIELQMLQNCTMPGETYPDMNITHFLDHFKNLQLDGGHGFSQEFLKLADAARDVSVLTADYSHMPNNWHKNRYRNIVAYDHSRVILGTANSRSDQSDYINANYIHGYKKTQTYIATQGPLPETVADFWLMVWEQNTSVIVMITNLMEKGIIKCEQYWPTTGEAGYGGLRVKLVSAKYLAYYTTRVFTIFRVKRHSMKGATERTVYHYHYTQWPDHGVPDYSLPVLSFVQKSAGQSGPDSGPIIVHCSAGVGRTGTYIVIDSMIDSIKDKQSVSILGFILDIRRQRNFLVQSQDQLKLIYEVLVEYLLGNGTTEVKGFQMVDHLMRLKQPFRSTFLPSISQTLLLEKQFKEVTEYMPKQLELSAALEPINQSKNRAGSILPVNSSRVVLPVRPAIANSDYINASFLQGYRNASEFIVTQHPMTGTVDDFWRMVWHVQSPVIVVLSNLKDQENKEFWPSNGATQNLNEGFIRASKTEPVSEGSNGFNTLEMVVSFYKSDIPLLTRIIVARHWPRRHRKLYMLFGLISVAQTFLTSHPGCGPVTVVDRFGGAEAGTFCALWTLRDQLLSESCADFYQVCKLYHYKRPGIFRSQEDYLLLHHAVAALREHRQDQAVDEHRNHHYHDHIYSNHNSLHDLAAEM